MNLTDKYNPVKDIFNSEIVSPIETTLYTDEIGLMYVSDYGYATSPENWKIELSDYNSARNTNWMHMGLQEWCITPTHYPSLNSAIALAQEGRVYTSYYGVSFPMSIRPVFYLKSNIALISGDGSKANPFRLSL